jgi:hypothetical protein
MSEDVPPQIARTINTYKSVQATFPQIARATDTQM